MLIAILHTTTRYKVPISYDRPIKKYNCYLHKYGSYDSIYVAIRCTTYEITENSFRDICWIIVIFWTLRLTMNIAST